MEKNPKRLSFREESQANLKSGIDIMYDAVSSTLGPRGNNVAYQRPFGTPGVVHDGVTVAKEIDLENPFHDIGAQLLREAASKTNDQAGDGTTTAIILAHALIKEGQKHVSSGHNPMMLRKGIDKAVAMVDQQLSSLSKPVKTAAETLQIATISAQNPEIGDIIAKAVEKLGKDAVITVEDGSGNELSVEYKDGMEFDRGFMSTHFMTDPEHGEAIVSDANILITNKVLGDVNELVGFFKNLEADKVTNNLVVIANDVVGQVLATLALNKAQGTLNVLAVKAPGFGDQQRDVLEDIAIVTGGTFISDDSGKKLSDVTAADLGHAQRVVSTKDNTVIVGGLGKPRGITERTTLIKKLMDKPFLSDFELEKYRERLAKLTSGIAIISAGAPSEAEMKEKKERIIDAISATKAALEEGIVPGGETALLTASYSLDHVEAETDEERVGIKLVRDAIRQPFWKLMTNSGLEPGKMLAQLEGVKPNVGVDVIDGQVKDLIAAGIIDPVKVPRCALRNAASTAVMVLTTNVLITDVPKEPEKDER